MGTTIMSNKLRVARAGFAAFALVVAACSDDDSDSADDSDPAAVLTDYLEVWNAEDGEAVMVFYAEDAVMEDHPDRASDELATGKSEILVIETGMQVHQGNTGELQLINMEVSGDTVTYDDIFHNAEGECFSSTGSVATMKDDLITLIVWGGGDTDADLC
jgi:ketosteroid isomerase-like protein